MAKNLSSQRIKTWSSAISEKEAMPFYLAEPFVRFVLVKQTKFLVCLGNSFKSGSVRVVNSRLKALSPAKPERTIKRAAVPTTMPMLAIIVM